MAQRHASIMLLFMLVAFYTPLIPLAPIIGLLGSIWTYWVNKYLLFKRHRFPEMIGFHMTMFFSNMIPWVTLIYGVSQFIFLNSLSDTMHITSFAALIVSISWIVLPIRVLLEKCCAKEKMI